MSKKNAKKSSTSAKTTLGIVVAALVLGALGAGTLVNKSSAPAPAASSSSSTPASASSAPAKAAPDIARIANEAKGFIVGDGPRAHTTYIFFDAQCSHCAALWNSMKPLESQTKAVWIPVHLLNRASLAQGAAILSAADPAKAMNEHEESLSAKRGGISAMSKPNEAAELAVTSNTKLFMEMGGTGVPYVVARNVTNGELVARSGAGPTAAMANLLGLKPPAP